MGMSFGSLQAERGGAVTALGAFCGKSSTCLDSAWIKSFFIWPEGLQRALLDTGISSAPADLNAFRKSCSSGIVPRVLCQLRAL